MIDLSDLDRRIRAYRVTIAVLDLLADRAQEQQDRAVEARSFQRAQEARATIEQIANVREFCNEEKLLAEEDRRERDQENHEKSLAVDHTADPVVADDSGGD